RQRSRRQGLGPPDGVALRDRRGDLLRARDPEAPRPRRRNGRHHARAAHQSRVSYWARALASLLGSARAIASDIVRPGDAAGRATGYGEGSLLSHRERAFGLGVAGSGATETPRPEV